MKIFLALLCFALAALPALAGSAAWYRWESTIDGALVCAQASPGPGWKRFSGPYRDAQCRHAR